MMTAALALLLAGTGVPSPTPTPTPKALVAPTLSRVNPAEGRPADLSSYAGKVKVDRGKADSIFRSDRPAPTGTPPLASRTPAGAAPEPGDPVPSASEEARWRERAASLRRDLDLAREERAAAERDLPVSSNSSQGIAQRNTLLYPHKVRIDRAQAAVDALANECRMSPTCQPGWVR